MGKLVVKLHGKVVTEVSMMDGAEYLFGRAEDCQIQLQGENGISRHHFCLKQENGAWIIESLSRFGEILVEGEPQTKFTLADSPIFAVPPYEFSFVEEPTQDLLPQPVSEDENLPKDSSEPKLFSEDKTMVGALETRAWLRVYYKGNSKLEIQLDGTIWIGGRDSTCTVHLNDPRISRRQFEISYSNTNYYLKDLHGATNTLINGMPCSNTELTKLKSGDQITVLDFVLTFELRDSNYEAELKAQSLQSNSPKSLWLPHQPSSSVGSQLPAPLPQSGYPAYPSPYPSPYPQPYPPRRKRRRRKKPQQSNTLLNIILVIGALAALYFYLEKPQPAKPKPTPVVIEPTDPFGRLPPEKQSMVRHSYNLAKNLFMQQKYELAAAEVAKVHQIIDEYKDSHEIENFSNEAIRTRQQKQVIEEEERRQKEIETEVASICDKCEALINDSIELSQFESCVAPAIEKDPENSKVKTMRVKVEEIISERARKLADQADYQDNVNQGLALFNRAENIAKANKYHEAIAAYRAHLNSPYPDPAGNKKKSQKKIKDIQDDLSSKFKKFKEQAQAAKDAGKWAEALAFLKQAKALDIDMGANDESLESLKTDWLKTLSKSLQPTFQEAILEESIGSVETAKEKWRKILQSSIPEETYYKKSKIKLKKYGE